MKTVLIALWLCFSITSTLGQSLKNDKPPFTLIVSAAQSSFTLGKPALIHIVLKDVSRGELTLPETRHGGTSAELNYRITVTTSSGSPVPDTQYGYRLKHGTAGMNRSVIIRYLNFDDQVQEDVDLNNVVKITSIGDYVVQVERADELYGPSHIKSNKLTIHVVP